MTDQVNITKELLEWMATQLSTKLTHLTVGTGSDDITLTTEDVTNPVSIQSGIRNLIVNDTTLSSNFFKQHWTLTAAMPLTLPVDYQQLGIHDGQNDAADLLWGHTLRVLTTKDALSQHEVFVSGRVVEWERDDI